MEHVRHHGELKAGTHEERLILLAGALAESGIAELELELSDVVTITLQARQTNLPGYLNSMPSGEATLRAGNSTWLMINRTSIVWSTTDEPLADRLRRAQG